MLCYTRIIISLHLRDYNKTPFLLSYLSLPTVCPPQPTVHLPTVMYIPPQKLAHINLLLTVIPPQSGVIPIPHYKDHWSYPETYNYNRPDLPPYLPTPHLSTQSQTSLPNLVLVHTYPPLPGITRLVTNPPT